MKAAVNASVLIALGELGYLKLVKNLFDKFVIAGSVFEEVKDTEVFEQLRDLVNGGYAEVVSTARNDLLEVFTVNLGKGEAETIALALEKNFDVVILDDLKARKAARKFKVKIVGTLGVIKALIEAGLVKESPEGLCERLIEQGFWIDRELCIKTLRN